jgi:2-C-methyl-D-erythritol 4-phosphate cytidylyltransferase
VNVPEVRCWGIIPAAGTGSRMSSSVPKQYLTLSGLTLLEHSLRALLACKSLGSVVVALHRDDVKASTLDCLADPRVMTVPGGETRCDSVLAALTKLAPVASDQDWVLVHDAARPCVLPAEIESLMQIVKNDGVGGILAEPMVDTVKKASDDDRIMATLDRSRLWRAQTPQMFRIGLLHAALLDAQANGTPVTDEASAMELAGHPVQLVPGSARNLKVTVPEDLQLAEFFLRTTAGET